MKRIIISFVIGLIIGSFIGFTLLNLLNIPINENKEYGILEAIYYIVSPIATLITFLAVIVAIFGNEIKMWIFREKCKVYIERDGFVEDIAGRENEENIEARQYECNLCIENIGSREIENCSLYLKSVTYKQNKESKAKKLKILNKKLLYWSKPDEVKTTLLTRETKKMPILRIHPAMTSQTPDDQKSSSKPPNISIMGYSLEEKFNRNGIWEIYYTISTPHKVLKEFVLSVSWTGIWKKRETEMSQEVTVELKN